MQTPEIHKSERLEQAVLLVLALGTSVLFLWMIQGFLLALLLAAILTGLFSRSYERLVRRLGGRRALASGLTVLFVLFIGVVPLLAFSGIVAAQAVHLAGIARPWILEQLQSPPEIRDLLERVPFFEYLVPYRDQILGKAGDLAGGIGAFAVGALGSIARETASLALLSFVMFYAMFFFLINGRATLQKILYYLPLRPQEEARMVGKFVSVTRATIKGTVMIGAVQGALAGIGFWVAGIPGAALWGTVMAMLSVIPGLGTAIVWVPAVIVLALLGRLGVALALGLWCAAVVGTVDNLLRPWLVGKDTKMSDLLILLSTLGGLVLFGAVGFVIGPIIAALFVTVWDLYGIAFRDILPEADLSVRSPSLPPESTRDAGPESAG